MAALFQAVGIRNRRVVAIEALTTTLYAMKVPSTSIKAYKAVVIILLVALSSPVVKQAFSRLQARMKGERPVVGKEAA